jgi:hypothetical protein
MTMTMTSNETIADQGAILQQLLDERLEPALVSASCSTGPDGANMKGWLTYDRPSETKIHFELHEVTERDGLFAGGGALPMLCASPESLTGKIGTFEAGGNGFGGFLQMWVGERAVLAGRLPVAGAGIPFANWRIKGTVRFTRP